MVISSYAPSQKNPPQSLPQETSHKQGTSCLPVFKDDSYGMPSCFLHSLSLRFNIWLFLNSAAASYGSDKPCHWPLNYFKHIVWPSRICVGKTLFEVFLPASHLWRQHWTTRKDAAVVQLARNVTLTYTTKCAKQKILGQNMHWI